MTLKSLLISPLRLSNRQSGSILIELVFVLPVFLFIALCGFELSRIMQAKQKTSMMAYEVARQVASECYYNLPMVDEAGNHFSIGRNGEGPLAVGIVNFYTNCLNQVVQRFTNIGVAPVCDFQRPCLSVAVLAPRVNDWVNPTGTTEGNLPEVNEYREIARNGTGGPNSADAGGTTNLSRTGFLGGGQQHWAPTGTPANGRPFPFAYKYNFQCNDCDTFLQQLINNPSSFILDLLDALGSTNPNIFTPVYDHTRNNEPIARFVPDMMIVSIAGVNFQSITPLTRWIIQALNNNAPGVDTYMLSSEVEIHY